MNEYRERRLALEALEKDAGAVWCSLSSEFRVDKECILRALKSPTLPPKCDFERQFPQKLRFDKDVVLGFCARPDFKELYQDRHLYVPGCLMNDKDVMVAYCKKIPRSLQECSERLCNDPDVVRAAIELDGLELQYAGRALQQDKSIVLAACRKDGRALEFCPPGPLRNELVQDREFMLRVLQKHGGPMLRLVPEPLRHDPQLLLEALQHGMPYRYCPFDYQNDVAFLLQALAKRATLYLEMNRATQAHPEIAKAAICSQTSTPAVQNRVLYHAPELKSQRDVALAICQRADLTDMKHYIAKECPEEFKNDYTIMRFAIQRDSKLFDYASPQLKQNTEIIMAALDQESAADVLAAVGPDALRQNPQIVVRAIAVYPVRNMRVLCTHVPEELWTNSRPVAVQYIITNGRVLDAFEPRLQTDEALALLVAEHAGPDFWRVGPALRADLQFMKRAVDKNGRVLRFASPELRQNLDLIVRAVANHAHAIAGVPPPNNLSNNANNNNTTGAWNTEQLKQFVQQKLELHQVFVEQFLRGIAIARPHLPPAQRSSLGMLDRGVETSQAFKQLIAEFLGVPIGTELKLFRTALINLTQPVPEAASHDREAQLYMVDRLARRRLHRAQRRGAAAAADDHHHLGVLLQQPDDRPARNRFGLVFGANVDLGPMPLRRRRGPWNRAGAAARIGVAAAPPLAGNAAEEDMDEDDEFAQEAFEFPPVPPAAELDQGFLDAVLLEEWEMANMPQGGGNPVALGIGQGPDNNNMHEEMAAMQEMMMDQENM